MYIDYVIEHLLYLQLKTNLYQVYQRQAEQIWNHETTLSVHRHRLVYAQESSPRESLVTQSRHTPHRWDPTKRRMNPSSNTHAQRDA